MAEGRSGRPMARREVPEPKPIRPPPSWLSRRGRGGFHSSVGFSVEPKSTGAGVCVVSGVVKHVHLNVNGVVHGGVYATILDTAMGGSVVTTLRDGEVTATTSLYIEFLRPAEEGAHLRARGEVVRRGRHLAFVEGNLYNGDGVRLSQAHGTWYIWSADDGTWTRRTTRMRRAAPAKP
jgi:uncharacterized protein (TIGR00369 family)